MSQVTIYLPEDVERLARREAQRARLSVSAWFARLAQQAVRPSSWPPGYFEQFEVQPEERFEVPERPPADEPDSFA